MSAKSSKTKKQRPTELNLWEEYKLSSAHTETMIGWTSLFDGKTRYLPFQITQKPTYEGFMDWKLERLKKDGSGK